MSAPITLHGRLGQDPELAYSKTGQAIAKLNVVTNIRRKDGEVWTDADTTWWNVIVFGRMAENVCESLNKGDEVIIEGKIKEHTWETPEGERRKRYEVTADHIGPNLRAATVTVTRVNRANTADDPWASTDVRNVQTAAAPF